jgi:hypothetical protein
MTVFDEQLSGREYLDMEFEEFMEFLVRIAFLSDDSSEQLPRKLQAKLRQILKLVGEELVES